MTWTPNVYLEKANGDFIWWIIWKKLFCCYVCIWVALSIFLEIWFSSFNSDNPNCFTVYNSKLRKKQVPIKDKKRRKLDVIRQRKLAWNLYVLKREYNIWLPHVITIQISTHVLTHTHAHTHKHTHTHTHTHPSNLELLLQLLLLLR